MTGKEVPFAKRVDGIIDRATVSRLGKVLVGSMARENRPPSRTLQAVSSRVHHELNIPIIRGKGPAASSISRGEANLGIRRDLEFIVPGLEGRRLKKEAREEAGNEREYAYRNLGNYRGENVTLEQIRRVLQAELDVASINPRRNKRKIEKLRKAQDVEGEGRGEAKIFFQAEARKLESEIDKLDPDRQRKIRACENADVFLLDVILDNLDPNNPLNE